MTAKARRRLLLATTIWKRPELTEAVLAYYNDVRASIADRIDLSLAAVGSEGRLSRDMCERNGFTYLEHANEPVTHKWNAIIGEAESCNPEGVILVNSDDLVSADLFDVYADRLGNGSDYFGLRGTHVFNVMTGQLGTWPGYEASYMKYRIGEPAGCARCFSRCLLETTAWRLWPSVPRKSSSMDFWCTQFLKFLGFEPEAWTMEELGIEAVQLKTDVNITTFNRLPLSDLRSGAAAWEVVEKIVGSKTTGVLRRLQDDLVRVAERSETPTPHSYSEEDHEPVHRIEDLKPSSVRNRLLAELEAMKGSVLAERANRDS